MIFMHSIDCEWVRFQGTNLGMQLGGVLSTSHVAKSFIGTGRLNPEEEEEEAKGAATAATAGDIAPPGTPPAPSGTI